MIDDKAKQEQTNDPIYYGRGSLDDKRQLLKLKQGLITKEETTLEIEQKPLIIKPTGKAAVENFFYHHKLHIWIVGFFAVIVGFFIYFGLSGEKADITILLISDSQEASAFFRIEAAELQSAIEHFVPDFDNNGKVRAECLFIDLTLQIGEIARNPEAVQGDRIKLFGEVQSGEALLFIGNRQALENIPGEEMVEDFYVKITDDVFYRVKGSPLEAAANFEWVELPDDLYIAVRKSHSNQNALTVFGNIAAG